MNENAPDVHAAGTAMSVFGVILIILGIFSMLAPGITGISVAVFVGFLMLLGGAVRIAWASRASSLGGGVFTFVIGLLTLIAGAMLVTDPLLASGFLTVMLAAYLIVDGIAEVAAGNQLRPAPGSGWLIFGGVMSVLLGIMIWAQYPLSGAYAIGILLGIKLFMVGLIMIAGGSVVRRATR